MKFLKYMLINTIIGGVITWLLVIYSQNSTLVGWMDAILIAGVILFTIGWFLFISNNHVFDIVTYGFQSFWKRVLGRGGMEKDYYTTISEKDVIPRPIYLSLWLAGLIYFVAGIIVYLVFYNATL